MKAKCPYCAEGCDRCQGGFTEVTFADGDVFTRHCNGCGKDNGGRIAAEFLKPPEQWAKPSPCVWCGSADMEWRKV